MPRLKKIAMVARWKPVHNGHLPVLRALPRFAEQVVIGIGSSNRYNLRNPFTLQETEDMLNLILGDTPNITILPIPDLDDGPRWRLMARDMLGPLDLFITDNPYVANLMKEFYPLERPVAFVPPEEQVPIDGTLVRLRMARGENWQELVPPVIVEYLTKNKLDERFRREFGLQTLAAQLQK